MAQTGGEWLSKNYILANDLILNDVELTWDADGNLLNGPATLHEWTPIGDNSTEFTGKFDGGGHTVSGVYINQPGKNYIGFFGYAKGGTIRDLTVVNSDMRGRAYVGGIAGYTTTTTSSISISNCVNHGAVTGSGWYVGGIVGYAWSSVSGCVNYGAVTDGGAYVGGIVGYAWSSVSGCVNYGAVTGNEAYVGGIAGDADSHSSVSGCANYGAVTGNGSRVGGIAGHADSYSSVSDCVNYGAVTGGGDEVGGIAGYADSYSSVSGCANCGTVTGSGSVGGISGRSDHKTSDCYNAATVTGVSNSGGIVGYGNTVAITNCYNIGSVLRSSGTANTFGSIIGSDGALWGKDAITGCYYLKSDEVNPDIYGCGGITSSDFSVPDGFHPKTADELKVRETFVDWAFEPYKEYEWSSTYLPAIWSISPDLNGGYPYLAWQDMTDVPLTGLTLNRQALSLSVGDGAYLTAAQAPATANLPDLTWASEDESVATVNDHGRVTAAGPGETEITASGGGFTASCTVTVTARQQSEYRIGTLSLRDTIGAALTEIPKGSFLVTIPIAKQLDAGNTMVALASYTAGGQYRGLLYVSVEDIPIGATVKITLPVDNTKGDIAQLKAFAFASFDVPIPLGEPSVFPS